MGRRSHSQTLHLWANGDYVGRWTVNANGDSELAYDAGWRGAKVGRPISLSLPFNLRNEPLKGANVSSYFEGLLPDSDIIRRRVATRFKTGSLAPFDLLAAVGRDCVGALQLLPEGGKPEGLGQVDGVAVDEDAIERHLLEVVNMAHHGAPEDPDDDFRISLAGAQEKDAFLWWDGKWLKPRGATPTTHIFKLPIGMVGGKRADFSSSVDNEWLCLRLFKEYGLPTANAEIATFGTQRVLVVERFDRRRSANGEQLFRLVQEDFCQATGTSPLLKYENDGGPGLKQMFTLLQQSRERDADMRTLMASQLLFWMLRAPDGHAKNFSIQLLAGAGRFQLTPIYDVMSGYPVIGPGPNQWTERKLKMAMALPGNNRHYLAHSIQRRHFNSTAKEVGYGANAEPLLQDFIARTPAIVDKVRGELPVGFSEKVADKILGGLLAAADALEKMPPA
ncbi:type II toxin-antitoxin system HipA family toxin [Janthinobacterium fluminis]|uniref:Type II toxin-antitoxin system HipA family toxin n=1 Tax=Janthinobacterium fluminis TaxID=2987524 RepID=A0ABT5KA76_9BURK|nr:type II toxin-antitoxin system HipA family toxin [Janthinobacterium fluminis]MDC8760737.1 type II toxin-antitoxin system HipA family toxin [Janthinobacterium fluminis]